MSLKVPFKNLPYRFHLLVGVQAGLELQDRLELLVRVEGDLDHAVDVVEAVPVLIHMT